MAGSDKVTHRVDSGGDSTESTQPVSEAPGSEANKSLKEQDADWGYEPGKRGMATEAKMGMCIVVLLVCAFGFLVYHKFDLKQRAAQQAMASQKSQPAIGNTAIGQVAGVTAEAAAYKEFYPESGAMPPAAVSAQVSPRGSQAAVNFDEAASDTAFEPTSDRELAATDDKEPGFGLTEPAEDLLDVLAHRDPGGQSPTKFVAENVREFSSSNDESSNSESAFDSFTASGNTVTPTDTPLSAAESRLAETTSVNGQTTHPDFSGFEFGLDSMPADAGIESQEVSAVIPPDFPDNTLPPVSPVARLAPVEPLELANRDLPAANSSPFDAFPASPESDTAANSAFEDRSFDSDEPQLLASLDTDQFPSAFQTEATPTESRSTTAESFSAFNGETVDAPVTQEPSPVRRSAPLPDFPIAEVQVPAATEPLPPETLVTLTAPAPDVDEFGAQLSTAGSKNGGAAIIIPTDTPPSGLFANETRPFGSHDDTIVPDPQPLTGDDTVAPISLPFGQPTNIEEPVGVAKFVKPGEIQQVSGVSTEIEICEVQVNDTYWTISRRVYGTARYFSSLALYNQERIPDPKKLRPGMKVLIPAPESLEQKYPELFKDSRAKPKLATGYFLDANGRPAYRIGERETLSEISQKHLGRASRWIQIYRMNPQILKDPNKLKPGTVIALPDDATSVHLAP